MNIKVPRPLGEILLDLEVLLDEMIDFQQLQWGDILSLIYSHLELHRPDAREEYLDGSHPVMYYGSKENK